MFLVSIDTGFLKEGTWFDYLGKGIERETQLEDILSLISLFLSFFFFFKFELHCFFLLDFRQINTCH